MSSIFDDIKNNISAKKKKKEIFSFKRMTVNLVYLLLALAWLYIAFRLWIIFIKFAVTV